MEKAKFTVKEAESFDLYKHCNPDYDNEQFVRHYVLYSHSWVSDLKPLMDMGFDKFVQALYCDYEVVKTPEEQIKDLYNDQAAKRSENQIRTERAIRDVLNILGLKIKGVNC